MVTLSSSRLLTLVKSAQLVLNSLKPLQDIFNCPIFQEESQISAVHVSSSENDGGTHQINIHGVTDGANEKHHIVFIQDKLELLKAPIAETLIFEYWYKGQPRSRIVKTGY